MAGLTGIGVYPDAVCLAQVVREGDARPRLVKWSVQPTGREPVEKLLGQLAKDHELKKAVCTTVLGDEDYKLLYTEAPDVKPDELKAAVRWRIKDLIDFHINDATLDVFDLPNTGTAGMAKEMSVVAARNQAIQKRVDLMDAAGINLQIIDIPELVQRNIAALLPQDQAGVVLLSLQPESGLITLTRNGSLFLSRNLSIGLNGLLSGSGSSVYFEQVVLEVQRSLDYFESHFREAPMRSLVVAPLTAEVPGLLDFLSANLGLTITALNLAEHLDFDGVLPIADQARCFATLGAALRREVKAL